MIQLTKITTSSNSFFSRQQHCRQHCRQKKKSNQQTGGAINQQLPVNILKRGLIMYYSINFYQHKIFYDFFDDKIVDRFFNSVQGSFESVRGKEFKM